MLASCGGGRSNASRTTSPPTVEPTSTDLAVTISPNPQTVGGFGPKQLTVPVGDEVQWNNWTHDQHTVTFDDASIPSSQPFGGGGSYKVRFPRPGTFTYHCSIHSAMTASIVVTP